MDQRARRLYCERHRLQWHRWPSVYCRSFLTCIHTPRDRVPLSTPRMCGKAGSPPGAIATAAPPPCPPKLSHPPAPPEPKAPPPGEGLLAAPAPSPGGQSPWVPRWAGHPARPWWRGRPVYKCITCGSRFPGGGRGCREVPSWRRESLQVTVFYRDGMRVYTFHRLDRIYF